MTSKQENDKLLMFGWMTTILGLPENADPTKYNELVDKLYELHTKACDKRVREARIDELSKILHTEVCEVMCGWSKECDVQGDDCPKIRKRLATLKSQED